MKTYDVVIFTDFEEGHVYPLFKMASNLEKNGISVCFAGIADTMAIVEKNGFNHYTILEAIFPKGYVQKMKSNQVKSGAILMQSYLGAFIDELETLEFSLHPKVIFSSYFFLLEALIIHYKCKAKQIVFHLAFPSLQKSKTKVSLGEHSYYSALKKMLGLSGELYDLFMTFFKQQNLIVNNFEEVVLPLKELPQVMLCPEELDLHKPPLDHQDTFLGPCINPFRREDHGLFLSELRAKTDRKIIFASMGSQTKEYPQKARKFFNAILKSMKSTALQDFHLVLSVGGTVSNWALEEIPENASVFAWVPQLEILQNATLAIIHGGLGSVKECIYYGVPMLVIPMGRDQMDNAKRVVLRQAGIMMNIDQVNDEILVRKIQNLMVNKKINRSLHQLQFLFLEAEKKEAEAALVKSLMFQDNKYKKAVNNN